MEIARIISEREMIIQHEAVISKLTKNELELASISLGNPISNMSNDQLTESVVKISKGIIKDVGIKSTDQYEVFRFLDILKKYYSNLTIGEVKTAFEISMVGDLDEFLPKDKNGSPDRNHYQSFSLEYITKILKAYKEYKNKVWFKAVKAIPEPEKVWSQQEIDEAYEGVWQDILDKFQLFKNEGILSDFTAPSISARVLHQKGKIVEICPVSDSDIRKSFALLMKNDEINVYDKSEMRKTFDSGKIHQRHFVEAERLRDLRIIREVFENEKEL